MCPHCGDKQAETPAYSLTFDEDEIVTECEECEKSFTVMLHLSYVYSTEKIDTEVSNK